MCIYIYLTLCDHGLSTARFIYTNSFTRFTLCISPLFIIKPPGEIDLFSGQLIETLIAILVVTLILIDLLTPIVKLCNSSTPFIYQKTTSSFTSSGLCDQASSTGINLDFSNLSQASISSLITRPKDNTYYMFSRKLRYGRK
ncbi:hypothetical protein F4703DRAFT_1920720 [Phycomyces blakesleeanus]